MKITVLGASGGYIGKNDPSTSLLVESKRARVVLDMGSGVLSSLEEFSSLDSVDAVFVSHSHGDHSCDITVASHGRLISRQLGKELPPLSVMGPDDPLFPLLLPFPEGALFSPVTPYTSRCVGDMTLSFFPSVHDGKSLAVKVTTPSSSLFYTSDTAFSENLAKAAGGVDILFSECSLYSSYGDSGAALGHMTAPETASFLSVARPGNAVLVHLPVYGDRKELLRDVSALYSGPVTLGRKGMVFQMGENE